MRQYQETFTINRLNTLLGLQWLWLITAIGFHALNWWGISHGEESYSLRAPQIGVFGLSVFIPILALGYSSHLKLYSLLNLIFISLIGYGALLLSIAQAFDPTALSAHPSIKAFYIGIAINLFGVPLGLYASWSAWFTPIKS